MGRPKGSKNKKTLLRELSERADVDASGQFARAERAGKRRKKAAGMRPEDEEAVKGMAEIAYQGKRAWIVRYLPCSRSMALVKWLEKDRWESEWVPTALLPVK